MKIFGITFLLYLLKISDGEGFWINYRNTDTQSYQQAVKVQKIYKKLTRCELAIKFLVRCRDAGVFPKFTRWKNANSKDFKMKNKYRRKVLLDEIREKRNLLSMLKEKVSKESDLLYANMTFMRKWALKYSIAKGAEIEKRMVTKRHEKKFTNLIDEKSMAEGTEKNPNNLELLVAHTE